MNLNNNDDDSSVEIGPDSSSSSPLPVVVKLEPGVAATDVERIVLGISREGSIICVDDVVITNNEDPIDLTSPPTSPTPSSPPPCRRPGH